MTAAVEEGMAGVYDDMERPLLHVLARMECRGYRESSLLTTYKSESTFSS